MFRNLKQQKCVFNKFNQIGKQTEFIYFEIGLEFGWTKIMDEKVKKNYIKDLMFMCNECFSL